MAAQLENAAAVTVAEEEVAETLEVTSAPSALCRSLAKQLPPLSASYINS
jgi:hypothetical protein